MLASSSSAWEIEDRRRRRFLSHDNNKIADSSLNRHNKSDCFFVLRNKKNVDNAQEIYNDWSEATSLPYQSNTKSNDDKSKRNSLPDPSSIHRFRK